ncbi:65-kDa microtubule-associated protein 8 [Tanacetum coccineum]|uniref:65-kDa microtubule-associated protein 8 n=1 Tax=Tanacetum coccineum TaxID=301880 RepID=A0ABQ4WN50_9ASTR
MENANPPIRAPSDLIPQPHPPTHVELTARINKLIYIRQKADFHLLDTLRTFPSEAPTDGPLGFKEKIKELELRIKRNNDLDDVMLRINSTRPRSRARNMHVFVGNFVYVVDFMALKNRSFVIEDRLSKVFFGKPFLMTSKLEYNLTNGRIRFSHGVREVIYRIPQRISEFDLVSYWERDKLKAVLCKGEEDVKKGARSYLYSFVLSYGFFSDTNGYSNRSHARDLLRMIWDEVGEDQFEREKVLVDLEHECLQVYRRKVDNANMSRARLHQELADSEAQFTHLLLSLDERSLPTRPEKMAGTLKEQLGAIAPALQKMQMRKAERMKQFRSVQSQIQKISTEIAGLFEYDDSLPDVIVNENDLSLKKLEEYQMELKRLHADKSDRLEKVKNYISTIQKLSATLGMDASMIITKVHPSLNEKMHRVPPTKRLFKVAMLDPSPEFIGPWGTSGDLGLPIVVRPLQSSASNVNGPLQRVLSLPEETLQSELKRRTRSPVENAIFYPLESWILSVFT